MGTLKSIYLFELVCFGFFFFFLVIYSGAEFLSHMIILFLIFIFAISMADGSSQARDQICATGATYTQL